MSQGIRADDQLLAFGTVNSDNHNGLKALAGQVRQGERVELVLLRGGSSGETVRVDLMPREGWGGRGLIGCALSSLSNMPFCPSLLQLSVAHD